MPTHISDKVAKALAVYVTSKNLSVKEICENCKVSISSLSKARRRLGIESRTKKHDKIYDASKVNGFIEEIRKQKNEKNTKLEENKVPKKPRANHKKTFREVIEEFGGSKLTKNNLTKHEETYEGSEISENTKKELRKILQECR